MYPGSKIPLHFCGVKTKTALFVVLILVLCLRVRTLLGAIALQINMDMYMIIYLFLYQCIIIRDVLICPFAAFLYILIFTMYSNRPVKHTPFLYFVKFFSQSQSYRGNNTYSSGHYFKVHFCHCTPMDHIANCRPPRKIQK